MNEQQMIQRADDYVLLCDGSKVALTTRSRVYLDDLFWHKFVRDRRSFFWDTDVMLNNLASRLRFFDILQVETEHRHGDLFVRRVADVFIFDVMQDDTASTIAICNWKDGRLCNLPIYNPSKCCEVIPWDQLIGHWSDLYKKAVYDVYGLDLKGWPYQIFVLARELFDSGNYEDAYELFRCAIARAKIENDDELVAKLENLEQNFLAR